MKIFCVRYPRDIVTDVLICLMCIFSINLILIRADSDVKDVCGTSYDIINKFLSENLWEADFSACEISYKTIPYVFDETYSEYSFLQKSQGFDIEELKGKDVIKISMPIKNYPGYENNDAVYINFLVYDNRIVAADILCTSINGFITGAVRDVNYQN